MLDAAACEVLQHVDLRGTQQQGWDCEWNAGRCMAGAIPLWWEQLEFERSVTEGRPGTRKERLQAELPVPTRHRTLCEARCTLDSEAVLPSLITVRLECP